MKRTAPRSVLTAAAVSLLLCAACQGKPAKTVQVPMRDGVNLATDIYQHPQEEGPWPVILTRTPYGKDGFAKQAPNACW